MDRKVPLKEQHGFVSLKKMETVGRSLDLLEKTLAAYLKDPPALQKVKISMALDQLKSGKFLHDEFVQFLVDLDNTHKISAPYGRFRLSYDPKTKTGKFETLKVEAAFWEVVKLRGQSYLSGSQATAAEIVKAAIQNKAGLTSPQSETKATDADCIFCKIVNGELPKTTIHEDDDVLAILDIRPISAGHTLVLPKKHSKTLADLNPAVGVKLWQASQRIAVALRKADLDCQDVNLYMADGPDAGQEVPHVHMHVIPREKNDGFGLRMPSTYGRNATSAQNEKVSQKLKQALQ